MKVHHLNCGTMCPPGGGLVNETGTMVCHCLLVESNDGLVLVDTGMGSADMDPRATRLTGMFRLFTRPRLDHAETAIAQVERLGFRAADVRHIVLTHLDIDHAGALSDFPHAKVHVHEDEYSASHNRKLTERHRYRPRQWQHCPEWVRHQVSGGEPWFGFENVREAQGLPPEILMVPLPGHSRGHAGVAVRGDDRWLLHAGDAYFYHAEMEPTPRCTPGLSLFQRINEVDRKARLGNQARLRALANDHASEVTVFCSHDPTEHARLADSNRRAA